MGRRKHKPQRTCIACRKVKDKRELIRVVRTLDGKVVLDPRGKAKGRGAYLCREAQCYEKNLSRERLAYSLKATLSPDEMAALNASLKIELSKA